jgi:RNA polymerase primary sigma factor
MIETISWDESRHAIKKLMQDRNRIAYDEIPAIVPEAEEYVEELDSLLAKWAENGILLSDVAGIHKPTITVENSPTADQDHIDPDNLLSLYLAEMSVEALLTADEEVALARQIGLGHWARRAIQETDYTAEEHERLQAQIKAGQAARERLSRANTRLVVSIAKRYRGYGLPFMDLIQAGNEGLMRAVDRYNPDRGYRFSTYATWWVRQAVTRSLSNHGRVVRIPVQLGEQMRRMANVSRRLEVGLGRQPNPEEIASAMDESADRIRQMMGWASKPLSLEMPVGLEGNLELGETIEDENTPDLTELSDRRMLKELLATLLGELDPREARIVSLRYGLGDGQMRTLKEVADVFGLSRERIRQLERAALFKLRILGARRNLEDFLVVG